MNIKTIILLIAFLISEAAIAQGLEFSNLTQNDVDDIINDMSSANSHTSVSGASSLGALFGFEIGIVGGMAQTPNIDQLVKDAGVDDGASELPYGGLLARVGLTSLFVFEMVYFPEMDFDGTSYQSTSFAAQYNFLSLPMLSFALKGYMTNTSAKYTQQVSGADVDVAIDNQITGVQLLVSAPLLVVEPYIGIGQVFANGTIDVTGSQTIFDTTLSSKDSLDSSPSSFQYFAGAEVNLLLFSIGAEVSHSFDSTRYGVKASFGF